MTLEHKIEIARAALEIARSHVARIHDMMEDAHENGAPHLMMVQLSNQLEGAERRLREQECTIQDLMDEASAAYAAQNLDAVERELEDVIEPSTGRPRVATLVARVMRMEREASRSILLGYKVDTLLAEIDLQRAALFVARHPEWLERMEERAAARVEYDESVAQWAREYTRIDFEPLA